MQRKRVEFKLSDKTKVSASKQYINCLEISVFPSVNKMVNLLSLQSLGIYKLSVIGHGIKTNLLHSFFLDNFRSVICHCPKNPETTNMLYFWKKSIWRTQISLYETVQRKIPILEAITVINCLFQKSPDRQLIFSFRFDLIDENDESNSQNGSANDLKLAQEHSTRVKF